MVFTPADDFLIMATDGLWDAVPVSEAAALAKKAFASGKGAQEVRRRAPPRLFC